MKEKEAIEEFKENMELLFGSSISKKATKIAIKAIKELEQYHSIGIVEECRDVMGKQQAKKVKNRKL